MIPTWKKSLVALVASGAAVVGLGLAGSASASTPPSSTPPAASEGTITVSGVGKVTVEPDMALLTLGVQATAPSGAEAMEQLTADSNALTEALEASGIAPEDIQTSGLNLWSMFGEDGITVSGYQASLNVNVTIRDIETVGSTIDAAQEAVGEGFTIGGVQFSFSDPESVLQEARADAVANAQTVAGQYADAAGLTLGAVVSIVESPSYDSPVLYGRADMVAASEASVAISPGTLDLSVTISVTFATTA
jgi:uncharacterized protein YggE